MKDEAFDFLPMIILLGIIIPICFGLSMNSYKYSREALYNERYDKTASQATGEVYYSNNSVYDNYSYEDAILAVSYQTYFMPSPRIIKIGDTAFSIQKDTPVNALPVEPYPYPVKEFIPQSRATLDDVAKAMNNWCDAYNNNNGLNTESTGSAYNLRFAIRFTVAELEKEADDCYSLYVVVYDSDGKKEYKRCLDGGNLDIPASASVKYITIGAEGVSWNLTPGTDYYIPVTNR